MNVLIITDTYPPIARAGANLMRDLSLEFRDHDHKVFVVTAVESNGKTERKVQVSDEEGITVVRVSVDRYKGIGYIRRGIREEIMPYIVSKNAERILAKDKIVTLYRNNSLREALRKNGQDYLKKNSTSKGVYDEILEIYERKRRKYD